MAIRPRSVFAALALVALSVPSCGDDETSGESSDVGTDAVAQGDSGVDAGVDVAVQGDVVADGEGSGDASGDIGGRDSGADDSGTALCSYEHGGTWLLSAIHFIIPGADGHVDGFDVDGIVSTAGDTRGCGKADVTSPDGRTGIDNQFATLLPGVIEQLGDIDSQVSNQITLGQLSYVFRVSFGDDDSCTFEIVPTDGAVMLDATGEIERYQTVGLDSEGVSTTTTCSAAPMCGSWTATGTRLELPFTFLGTPIHIALEPWQLSLDVDDTGLAHILVGGAMPMADVDIFLEALSGDTTTRAIQQQVRGILPILADTFPDEDGECTGISAGLRFEALPAYVFE